MLEQLKVQVGLSTHGVPAVWLPSNLRASGRVGFTTLVVTAGIFFSNTPILVSNALERTCQRREIEAKALSEQLAHVDG